MIQFLLLIISLTTFLSQTTYNVQFVNNNRNCVSGVPDPRDEKVTPNVALQWLMEGNKRWVDMNYRCDDDKHTESRLHHNEGQWPFASIVSCSDSRTAPELIFDSAIGEVFIVRNAGNTVDSAFPGGVVASLEYATFKLTSNLIVVIGHTKCGAVIEAIRANVTNSTAATPSLADLIRNLKPAVDLVYQINSTMYNIAKATINDTYPPEELVTAVVMANVYITMQNILKMSPGLSQRVQNGTLALVGAGYDMYTGKVYYFTKAGNVTLPPEFIIDNYFTSQFKFITRVGNTTL